TLAVLTQEGPWLVAVQTRPGPLGESIPPIRRSRRDHSIWLPFVPGPYVPRAGQTVKLDQSHNRLSIAIITDAWSQRTMRPNPEYQRGLRWNREQQQLLIDSVFRGYPLPTFYFERKDTHGPLGDDSVTLDVIDGQQRIIALTQFRNNQWPTL